MEFQTLYIGLIKPMSSHSESFGMGVILVQHIRKNLDYFGNNVVFVSTTTKSISKYLI